MNEMTPNLAPFESWNEKEKEEYFWQAVRKFSNPHAEYDSIVRLTQRKSIAEDLDSDVPILIRGNWRWKDKHDYVFD